MLTRAERNDIDKIVGWNLRTERMARKMSQQKLACAIGLTFQQIQKYERGSNRISASRMYEISEVLGIQIQELFRDIKKTEKCAEGKINLATIRTAEALHNLPPKKRAGVMTLIKSLKEGE